MYKAHNPLAARMLLFFCRNKIPFFDKMFRILLGCDIYCDLKNSTITLPHPYGVIIHSKAILGKNIIIMSDVVIGQKYDEEAAPVIEDDVFIGSGAKLLGGIRVGRGAVIGANAIVTKDVPEHATVVGANRIIFAIGSRAR